MYVQYVAQGTSQFYPSGGLTTKLRKRAIFGWKLIHHDGDLLSQAARETWRAQACFYFLSSVMSIPFFLAIHLGIRETRKRMRPAAANLARSPRETPFVTISPAI
jgi:hypothetical protein